MAEDNLTCGDLEQQLAPYVDGEVSPAERRAIDAHLAACPPCQAQAEAERTAREVVTSRRETLRASAPAALRARCARLRQEDDAQADRHGYDAQADRHGYGGPALAPRASFVRRWAPLSLAATLVLAVAGVFVFGLNDRVQALAAGLALDHTKCFHVGDRSASPEAAAEERSWEQAQGWAIVVPQTCPAEELKLVDVRRCFSTDGRMAHIMFLWHGVPLSLFVLPRDVGADRTLDTMGHEARIWSANGRTYTVLADGHPADFPHIVDYLKAHAR